MKIVALVKFVPDVDEFQYDYKTDRIDRSNSKQIVNPDDACALAWALKEKRNNPQIFIEIVSMAPKKFEENMKNFVRLGADKATLISDTAFSGSDALATSLIIGKYLQQTDYDLILSGTHTMDGGTGHIGPQLAEMLGLPQFSQVFAITDYKENQTRVKALVDEQVYELSLSNPCLLSITSEMKEKLGFVRYDNRDKNVDSQFQLITNADLQLDGQIIGRKGSPTKVRKNVVKKREKLSKQVYENLDEGVEVVYQFLEKGGYLADV
jgi:electron transfer flavoprotein beta subunit